MVILLLLIGQYYGRSQLTLKYTGIMGNLGNRPKNNLLTMNSSQYSGDNSNTTFTLSQSVGNVNEIEVYVGNVRQDPFSAYSVTGGTSLVFTAAPPLGTNNVYVVYQGKAVGTTTPGENSAYVTAISNRAT